MIKDLIRLKHAKLSHAQIAATLRISKGVVAKYAALASAAGFNWETVQDWSEQQLAATLQPRVVSSQSVVVPDWARIHRELDRKGMTLMLLWQEYVQAHPHARTWGYTQFFWPAGRQHSGRPRAAAIQRVARPVLPVDGAASQTAVGTRRP